MTENILDIDVIIPAYNSGKYILETVDSVLAQDYPVKSIIIVDDCSTDETEKLITALENPKIKLVHHEKNQGVSAARNTGLKHATSEYIALVDADDVWEKNKLQKQMALFHTSQYKPGVVYCDYSHINDTGDAIAAQTLHPKYRGNIFKKLLSGNFVSGSASAVLIKKEFTEQVAPFRTDLFYGEDWDYWLRLSRICTFDFVEEPLVKIRIHANNAQHGQVSDPIRLARFLDQELQLIAPWSKEVRIPYGAYLRYFNRRYMLGQEDCLWTKLQSAQNYMDNFAPYHHKYFALSWAVMLFLSMRRNVRKIGKNK